MDSRVRWTDAMQLSFMLDICLNRHTSRLAPRSWARKKSHTGRSIRVSSMGSVKGAIQTPGLQLQTTEKPIPEVTLFLSCGLALPDYILQGPLLRLAGLPEPMADEWLVAGRQLVAQLGFEHESLDEVQK